MESFDSSRVPSALSAASFPLVFWVCGQAEDSVVRMPLASVMAMWLSPRGLGGDLERDAGEAGHILAVDLVEGDIPALHLLAHGGASSLGSTKVVTRSVVVLDVIC